MENNVLKIKEVISDWNAFKPVKGVNMGGLGEGYDTGIQSIIMEFLTYLVDNKVPSQERDEEGRKEFSDLLDKAYDENPNLSGQGYSGAMVGAAKGVAYQFWVYGYDYMMNKAVTDIPDRVRDFVKPS